jgi:hypothetical protein
VLGYCEHSNEPSGFIKMRAASLDFTLVPSLLHLIEVRKEGQDVKIRPRAIQSV